MKVTVLFNNGTESQYEAQAAPWNYNNFVVIDDGGDEFHYIPSSQIQEIRAPRSQPRRAA